jgi:hypothetical protein
MQVMTGQTQNNSSSFSKTIKAWRSVRKYSQLALACDVRIPAKMNTYSGPT